MRVLVIDDDALVVRVLIRELSQFGFDVRGAASSADLPASLSGFTPNVAIVDLHVGSENGLEIFELVRAQAPQCGAIVVTGCPDEVPRSWKAVTLAKPWEPGALLLTLLQSAAPP